MVAPDDFGYGDDYGDGDDNYDDGVDDFGYGDDYNCDGGDDKCNYWAPLLSKNTISANCINDIAIPDELECVWVMPAP